jgi:hypothetical protein
MSACIIAAQLVMLPVALLVGAKADKWLAALVTFLFAMPETAITSSRQGGTPAGLGRRR